MRTLDRDKLPPHQERLLRSAQEASVAAHCPHSGFSVGAALLLETPDGERVVTGTNYETSNYNSICAEKAALSRAYTEHSWQDGGRVVRPRVLAVAVYCQSGGSAQQPCGDCRQALFDINPNMQVISAAGPRRGLHDPRASITTVRELLPHGFELLTRERGQDARIEDSDALMDYIVHLPRPDAMVKDRQHRQQLLEGVRHLLLVGSPRRARRVATMAHERFGALHTADEACFCDLTVPGRDETGREYAVYVVTMPDKTKIAVASHGIGPAGAEIILSELPAAIAVAQGGQAPHIAGIIRAGTRGTLSRVPLGCVALSTSTCNEHLDRLDANPAWLDRLRNAAKTQMGMEVIPEHEIEPRGEDDWPQDPTKLLIEGLGASVPFFWAAQGRPLYRPQVPLTDGAAAVERRARAQLLENWRRQGVRWVEMEDYTVHRIAAHCGYPCATVGAVIAHRQRADGVFQLDYSKEALSRSELLPTELALRAFGEITK